MNDCFENDDHNDAPIEVRISITAVEIVCISKKVMIQLLQ